MMDLSLKVEDSERHLQYICAGYQLFAIEGGCCFFHLKYVFIEYHPIEAEGGRYGRSCSIHFNTFLPKRGHQTVKCPMATLLFILWLIIRQLPFEGVPIGPFSVQWARSTTGRQLSERCLYFLTIPVLCPQRKIFDTVVLLPIPSTLQPKPQP